MALTHLVDTSVLTRLHQPIVRDVIEARATIGELARPGIADLEIGFSTRNAREWDRLMDALSVFDLIETDARDFHRARQVQRLLVTKQKRGRKIPDLLIAAAAEARGLAVLHYDTDFDRIASVTGQRCEWVVPAGTVD